MPTPDNTVSIEKDYILSCATLFSEIGFPKSAFIKMVGTDYASDIFELMYDGKLVISGNVFFYPQRDKRKKRINQDAKHLFYTRMINELSDFIHSYVDAYGGDFSLLHCDLSHAQSFFVMRNQHKSLEDAETTAKKYHRNLGLFICETLKRAVDKMPLNNEEAKQTYNVLGWYYSVLREHEQSEMFFNQAIRLS